MKRVWPIALLLLVVGCNDQPTSLINTHYKYEGTIDGYYTGPIAHPPMDITMELWFEDLSFIHGYWQDKKTMYKYYLKGNVISIRNNHGYKGWSNALKDCEISSRSSFTKMKKESDNYRIILSEYSDENFSRPTSESFYVYNFEDGRLAGCYYNAVTTRIGDGKRDWSTYFTTLFRLKGTRPKETGLTF